jgi:hypothetical protein
VDDGFGTKIAPRRVRRGTTTERASNEFSQHDDVSSTKIHQARGREVTIRRNDVSPRVMI